MEIHTDYLYNHGNYQRGRAKPVSSLVFCCVEEKVR